VSQARILVVEDESIVALDMCDRLERMGYAVLGTVARGEDAVRQVAEVQPDLVLMDIRLRGKIDGIEAARQIRDQSDVPVIYMTAHAEEETLQRAKITAPSGYVLKPFEERELRATIEMALYKHRTDEQLKAYAAELRRANRQLALINKLISASADGLDERTVLEMVCQELAYILDVPYAVTSLLDRDGTTARILGEYDAEGRPGALGRTIPLNDTPIMQYVLKRREPLIIDSFVNDPRLVPFRSLMRRQGDFSLLLMPLNEGGNVIGGLGLLAPQERPFSTRDIDLSWTVANQLASALSRIRLNQERKRLTAAIEQAAESVIITDAEGTILYVNPAFERISEYSRAEALGRNPRLLKSGVQDAQFYDALWETLRAERVWHGQLANRKKGGALYIAETNIAPVRGEKSSVVNYVCVQRDVTEELRREGQYHQALKMEAVGRLAAGVAHDFNNLLTAINGYASLLKTELPPGDPNRSMAQDILAAGEHAADLTRQLLDFSRKQVVEPKVLHLNDIVTEMASMLKRMIGEDIELRSILAPDLWPVKVDVTQIERAIVNLAVNARDAMPEGGQLTIKTANCVFGQRGSSCGLNVLPGEYVLLAVSDTGVGMSLEAQEHLFEPFFTTKEVGQGTGLGLATVYGIVKQGGGTMQVRSKEGQGTVFEIYLPRVRNAVSSPRGERKDGQVAAEPGRETILLVEDNESVRRLTHRVLERHGYTLIQARNGQEAHEKAASHSGPVHLLLTDVIMPGGNGKALADQLTGMWPDLKVIFMSGYADEAIGQHGVLEPDVDFLPKPFAPLDLAQKVRAVLDRETTALDGP
jgi:PAS domain S-box-containing protein